MEQLQGLWSQIKAVYAKLPEIIRFLLAIGYMLLTWAIVGKIIRVIWQQLEKLEYIKQAEPYFTKLILYLPFVVIAVLFLAAFNRIAELLKK